MKTNEETIHLERIVFPVKNVNSLRTNGKERKKGESEESVKVYIIYIYILYV